MHRNCKSGIYSNNSNRYNKFVNKTTKNITFINDEDTKINCNKIYDVSISQKTKKMLNYRNKYYKINDEDIIN